MVSKFKKLNFKMVFINGKQKRIRVPETIEGMTVDEFIENNGDMTFLHQNKLWHVIQSNGSRVIEKEQDDMRISYRDEIAE